MKHEYIQSKEFYKGFDLIVVMRKLDSTFAYHRECDVWKDGLLISIGKTKKECKELIDGGYIK